MGLVVDRFDVFLINLDPTLGHETKKTRPCLIISPDEMNRHIRTVIIAPMTTAAKKYPTRVNLKFQEKQGQIVLDQLRTIDKNRLLKKIGRINDDAASKTLEILVQMFYT
ncbi:MAG: type II toxin-antitoxin system PemK/MazF family toxin [Acidobacteriota bacterium]